MPLPNIETDDGHGFTEKEQSFLDDAHCGNFCPSEKSESLLERFHSYQQERKDNGRIMSIHARLMSRIVDLSRATETKPSSGVSHVKTRDLTIIVEALNSLDRHTTNTSCEVYFQIYSDSKASRGYPVGLCELLEAYKTAWINLQRGRMPDYTQVLRVDTSNDRANGVIPVFEGNEERTIDQDQCGIDAMVDHGNETIAEVNDQCRESDGHPLQVMPHGPSRSPSLFEDGEVPQEPGAPAASQSDNDHLHESRRILIRGHHDPEDLTRKSFLGLPDIIATGPMDNNPDSADSQLPLPSLGPEGEHTTIGAPEEPIIFPRMKDPYRDSTECYGNGRNDDATSDFLNVDELINDINKNLVASRYGPTTTRTSDASNRSSDLIIPPSGPRRSLKRSQTGGSRNRRNVQGANQSRNQRSGGKNSTNQRRGAYQQGRSQGSRLQPPNGPRAWLLEEAWRRK